MIDICMFFIYFLYLFIMEEWFLWFCLLCFCWVGVLIFYRLLNENGLVVDVLVVLFDVVWVVGVDDYVFCFEGVIYNEIKLGCVVGV